MSTHRDLSFAHIFSIPYCIIFFSSGAYLMNMYQNFDDFCTKLIKTQEINFFPDFTKKSCFRGWNDFVHLNWKNLQ